MRILRVTSGSKEMWILFLSQIWIQEQVEFMEVKFVYEDRNRSWVHIQLKGNNEEKKWTETVPEKDLMADILDKSLKQLSDRCSKN